MSRHFYEQLRKVAPGFKEDRDETWMSYLPLSEQVVLRKWRKEFLERSEELDDLRLDSTAASEEKQLQEELNNFIKQTLLIQIPSFRRKADRIRDEKVENDFTSLNKRPRMDLPSTGNGPGVGLEEYLPHEFLPSAMASSATSHRSPEPRSTPNVTAKHKSQPKEHSREKHTVPAKQPETPPKDTFLDGVPDAHKDILIHFRPIIDEYKCKDRVLEALDSFFRHDSTIETLSMLKDYVKSNQVK